MWTRHSAADALADRQTDGQTNGNCRLQSPDSDRLQQCCE